MAQELWLTEKQLPLLHQLNAQFIARSGMEEAVSSGVLRGRPFGGVSIAWSANLNKAITPLANYKHKRVVAIKLKAKGSDCIFITVYMPFFDQRNKDACLAEAADAISMIDLIVSDHPNHVFVLGGDLNCELNGASPFDSLWNDFAVKNSFAYCSHVFPSPEYTYHHSSLGHKKVNDHFLVSKALIDQQVCKNYT